MADEARASTSARGDPRIAAHRPHLRLRWRHVIGGTLVALLLAGAYAVTVSLYVSAQKADDSFYQKNPGRHELTARVSVRSLDPSTGDLVISVDARPSGSLARPDGLSVTRPVHIEVVGPRGPTSYDVPANGHLSPVVANIGMNGSESSYPFDAYTAPLLVSVGAPAAGKNAGNVVPTLTFNGTFSGYTVRAAPRPGLNSALLGLAITVRRASVTIAFAVLMLVLQGLLAAAAAAATFMVWRQRWRAHTALLTWLAAMLFAIVPLREAMPGAPPIGAEIDILVFLWAVAIIVFSLVAVFIMWARRSLPFQDD